MLTASVVLALLLGVLILAISKSRRGRAGASTVGSKVVEVFPQAGVLVGPRTPSGSALPAGLEDALEQASAPISVRYRPLSDAELTRFRSIPVNATAQRAIVDIVRMIGPKGPTLFTVDIPAGTELVKAANGAGFRGVATAASSSRFAAQAVIKPVGLAGAAAVSWPVLAVAASVMALDMVNQREQRAHQRRIEAGLRSLEQDFRGERIARLRATDKALSGAISRLLDGQAIAGTWEHARTAADHELELARQFLDKIEPTVERFADEGSAKFRALSKELGGTEDLSESENGFSRDLAYARARVSLARKALLTEAAEIALQNESDPFGSLVRHMEGRLADLAEVDARLREIATKLTSLELKGVMSAKKLMRQRQLLAQCVEDIDEGAETIELVALPSGEVRQLEPIEVVDQADSTESMT